MGDVTAVRSQHHYKKQYKNTFRNNGMSLIEVLVALLVLGVGVMGFAALQLKSVKVTEETYSRSQAMSIAQDLVERVRVNALALGTYSSAESWSGENSAVAETCRATSVGQAETACTEVQMASADIYESRLIASSMLENGQVQMLPCSSVYCITVAWSKTALANCDQSDFSDGTRGDNAHCVIVEFIP